MSDQAEEGRGLVPVQYHQFQVNDEDGPAGPDLSREHNGLIEVQDGVATVRTGIHTGNVDVTVTLHTDTPQRGGAEWDEIVEVSLHSVSGELRVRGLMDDLDDELPLLSFTGPGDYLPPGLERCCRGCRRAVGEFVADWRARQGLSLFS